MSIQPNYPDFDPAVAAANTGKAYEEPNNTVYQPPVLGTGNPDPVYDPAFATASENIAYEENPNQGPPSTQYDSPADATKKIGNAYQTAGTIYGQFPIPTTGNPVGVYGPAFVAGATGHTYQAAGTTFNNTTPGNTGNPDPVYDPGYFAKAIGNVYQSGATTVTDSQVTSPAITFQVNLLSPLFPGGDELPNRTTLDGNEVTSEAYNQLSTRTVWFPDIIANADKSTGGSVAVAGIGGVINSRDNPLGYLHHGSQFTVKGQRALYLKSLFVSSPAAPADLLIVISQV